MRVVVVAGALIVAIALIIAVLGHKINQSYAMPGADRQGAGALEGRK